MNKVTIIPDIHADVARLEWSLQAAENTNMIFLGDLIDSQNDQNAADDAHVLTKVCDLIERGKAMAILGNHELNALLYHRKSSVTGQPLRKHSDNNEEQHKSFINQFGVGSENALAWTSWMLRKLPLWIELPEFRCVHAFWSDSAISEIKKRSPEGFLKEEDLEEIADGATEFAKAVKLITCGPEVELPKDVFFNDKNDKERREMRLAWWVGEEATWREAALSVPDKYLDMLPTEQLSSAILQQYLYPKNSKPVFVGHYKMSGAPKVQSSNATSLDYPEAPCVYQWRGEQQLTQENLVFEAVT